MLKDNQPPEIAKKVLYWYCNKELVEEIEGDLNEEYLDILRSKGAFKARLFYISEVIRFLRTIKSEREYQSKNTIAMFQNYIKVAFRNLLKYKAYSFINISGLAVGLACAFLIFLFVKIESSYDKFHENGDQIYRLQHVYGFINALAGPGYKEHYSSVKGALRLYPWKRDRKVTVNKEEVYHEDVYMADSNLFTFFTFPMVNGDPASCLSANDNIVISEKAAKKYFGDGEAVGQIIIIEDITRSKETPFKVTGVFEDIPFNSHLKFDMVVPFDILYHDSTVQTLKSWPNDWIGTYVMLEDGVEPGRVEAEYANLRGKYWEYDSTAYINFMPLTDLHLKSHDLKNDYAQHGNINHVRIFTAIAILIVIIACINFMNLATAQSSRRSKEVGVRKVMGAFRKQLIIQFFSESFILTLIALVLAIGLVFLAIPWLNTVVETNLYFAFENLWAIVSMVLVTTIITFLIAGSYPALFLSSFQPASILGGKGSNGKTTGLIRKSLVVFQFTISVILIIGAIVVYNQMNFMQDKELGFNAEQILVTNFGSNSLLRNKWPMIRSELQKNPNIQDIMITSHVPGDNAYYWGYKFDGYTERETGEGWRGFYIGENVIQGLEMEMVLGRPFSAEIPSDSNAFILNESGWEYAITNYGEDWKQPIGKTIEYYTTNSGAWKMVKKGQVIGVVKDFHHDALQKPIDRIVMHNSGGSRILLKVNKSNLPKVIDYLADNWTNWGSPKSFEYKFLDESFNNHYRSEQRFGTFLLVFCTLAIVIACLGLFGLASFVIEQKTKEIGIRKVLGASVNSIVKLLSSDFMKLVLISILVATPIAYVVFEKWLENFSYRINLTWMYFILAFIVAISIALVTVSFHSIKAAFSNPVDSLRVE